MNDQLKQLLSLGRAFFEKKQFAQAEQYLTQVVEQNQSFADVYNMLGLIFHEQGHFARAQRSFEAALRINPGYTDAALNLSIIYNDMGKYAEARSVYQRALSMQRASPTRLDPFVQGKIANMYAEIGDVYASTGMLMEAIVEYRRAIELGPRFVDIRLKLADSLRDLNYHDAALQEFEELLKVNPQFELGRVHYGIALFSAGRKAEAISLWEDVLNRNPGSKSAQMYLNLMRDVGNQAVPQRNDDDVAGS